MLFSFICYNDKGDAMKRGFTLIEMLATIVIIGIIALVAIPVVTNAVEDAKIGVAKRNIENLEDIINRKIAIDLLKGNIGEKSYVYSDGKSTSGDLDKAFKGKRPDEAIIHVNEDGKIEYAIYYEDTKTCAYKSYDSNEYTFKKNITDKNKCIGKLSINLLTNKQIISIDGLKNYTNSIVSVDFVDHTNVPEGVQTYDISLNKDGSIIGWLEPTDDSLYKLYIGSEGKIYTPTHFSIFFGMEALETVNFNNINTINATYMANLFGNCIKLKNIYNINNLDTSNVTRMDGMFEKCTDLVDLDLSNFNTSNVTNMARMFLKCSSLLDLDLSNFDTSNVTDMAFMFGDCSSLTNLNVSSFNTAKVTDMSYAFSDCSSLSNLNISNFNTSNVTNMSSMFSRMSSLETLILDNFDFSNYQDSYLLYNLFDRTLNESIINLSLENAKLPTNCDSLFYGVPKVKILNLKNVDTSAVTNMAYMFYFGANNELEELDLSSFNTSNVTEMNLLFAMGEMDNNNTLTPVNNALTTIKVGSNWSTNSVTSDTNMFYNCTHLVGGSGTVFDSNYINKTYAHVDGGQTNPGYLT